MENQKITVKTVAMRNGTLKMKNDGDYWHDEDRQKLKQMFYAGVSYSEIALELERTEPAVQQQIGLMQLIHQAHPLLPEALSRCPGACVLMRRLHP